MESVRIDFDHHVGNVIADEILSDNPNIYDSDRLNHKYWKQVKKEINNL